MATYYVYSGAGGANDGSTFANSFTAFTSALTAAASDGDVIKIHYTHQDPIGDKTYTILANISIIAIDGNSSDAPTAMGTSGYLGYNTTTGYSFTLNGGFKLFAKGLTVAVAGSSTETVSIGLSDGTDFTLEDFRIQDTNTGSSSTIGFGPSTIQNAFIHLKNFTFRSGHIAHGITIRGATIWEGGGVDSGGSAPTNLIEFSSGVPGATPLEIIGADLSHCTGTLVQSSATARSTIKLIQCKLGNTIETIDDILATQTPANRSSAEVFVHDCWTNDTQGIFAYANALGLMVSDTSITFTGTAASQSWKVVGTANATRYSPFYTPWIDRYAAAGTLLAYMEILRDGNPAAYTNAEVWLEGSSKTTASSTKASFLTDRATVLAAGADQDAGSGVGSWSGESANSWSGSLGFLVLSPVEDGYVRCRVAVGGAFTVYIDPVIRS